MSLSYENKTLYQTLNQHTSNPQSRIGNTSNAKPNVSRCPIPTMLKVCSCRQIKKHCCNMEGLLVGVSVPRNTPEPATPKENHTEISINYKTNWTISSGYLLALVAYINSLFLSMLATRLSTFFSR